MLSLAGTGSHKMCLSERVAEDTCLGKPPQHQGWKSWPGRGRGGRLGGSPDTLQRSWPTKGLSRTYSIY